MSTIIETEPARAIRNALERLRLRAAGTPIETDVAAESAIIEAALVVLAPEEAPDVESVRKCRDCGNVFGSEPGPCPWCDVFGAPAKD